MEARRRIALLCSHLRPTIGSSSPVSKCVWVSNCASIPDSGKGATENNCIFCKIIRGESPAFKLYEDDICLCILDTYPVSDGHSLIIPKSHFSSLRETPPSVVAAMCSKVPIISNAVMKATGCGKVRCPVKGEMKFQGSFNLLVNNGAAAGQVIFHTHLHIIPRKASDCLWTSESLRRHPLKLDQETHHLADKICKELLLSDNSDYTHVQGSSISAN